MFQPARYPDTVVMLASVVEHLVLLIAAYAPSTIGWN
jgi:hypothetical protein